MYRYMVHTSRGADGGWQGTLVGVPHLNTYFFMSNKGSSWEDPLQGGGDPRKAPTADRKKLCFFTVSVSNSGNESTEYECHVPAWYWFSPPNGSTGPDHNAGLQAWVVWAVQGARAL